MSIKQLLQVRTDYKRMVKLVNSYNKKVKRNYKKVTSYHWKKINEQLQGVVGSDPNKSSFLFNGNEYQLEYSDGQVKLLQNVLVFVGDKGILINV